MFWSFHGPLGLHEGHGSSFNVSSPVRHQDPQIPRRLASSGPVKGAGPQSIRDFFDYVTIWKSLSTRSSQIWFLPLKVLTPVTFGASAQPRLEKLLSIGDEFLSSRKQPVSSWRILLGTLSSLTQLVPGGRLRMRSLQLTLYHSWYQVDDSVVPQWDDLCWWLNPVRLGEGVSLSQVSPNLDFWSDASDVGWGAHLDKEVVSGCWPQEEISLSINARELLAVERGLLSFQAQISGSKVAVYADNSTVVSYLRQAGGHSLSDSELHCSEDSQVGRRSPHCFSPSVHHGEEQCASGCCCC